jgi:hypothetical protein
VILAGAAALQAALIDTTIASRSITPEAWGAFLETWHDFFVLSGTAAAALAALLFVAIALHIETLVIARRDHLLALARTILFSFMMVLILSLMMLAPHLPRRAAGYQLIALGLVSVAVTLRQLQGHKAIAHEHFSLGLFRRRLMLPFLGYAMVAAAGFMVARVSPYFLYWLVGSLCLLLGNAAGASWDLLVRVARIKRADAEESFPEPKKADVG